jgi:serine/threonine protein kinase
VMFQLLTGDYPFQAEDPRQIALMHLQGPAPRPSDRAAVPPAVDAVVLRCLEKNAQRRFGSANELLAALRSAVEASVHQADEHDVRALGIYLELTTLPDAELDDDAIIEDIGSVLDSVENLLTSRNYSFPLRTSNALLAVRMPTSEAEAETLRVEVTATINELRALLAERTDPHPDVQVAISMRANEVRCRTSNAGDEIVGGPLLEVGNWTANRRAPG